MFCAPCALRGLRSGESGHAVALHASIGNAYFEDLRKALHDSFVMAP
jgi:hypothetical protein